MKRLMSVLIVGLLMVSSAAAFADTVYATKNGKKYHHADCPLIQKRSPAAIAIEEAQQKGLMPCSRCFKESVTLKSNDVKLGMNKKNQATR